MRQTSCLMKGYAETGSRGPEGVEFWGHYCQSYGAWPCGSEAWGTSGGEGGGAMEGEGDKVSDEEGKGA